tara:strand:+ start:300436 stop:302049 length:1614 start_codon:yes stop_codon:yes gene_type:complete
MSQTLIHDLLYILSAGLLAGLICKRLRVSVLIGYLVAGVILGQGMLGLVLDQHHQLENFAEAGVFLLLFSIGLEFSLDDLAKLGRNLVIGGATQMLLVALPFSLALRSLGIGWQSSLIVASAIAFSSTVLVFRALAEWGKSEQPPGRRAIGILLFQDAALVPLLLLVPLLTGTGANPGTREYIGLVGISAMFVIAVISIRYSLGKWLIPRLAGYRSPELVILFTIVLLSGVTLSAHLVGLPPAVGAFAAGLIFNGNRWTKQIDALVLPFRETFAVVFFVGLGLVLDPRLMWNEPLIIFGGLASVVTIKAAAATVALRMTGLSMRDSLGMGIGLAHIGEFAFVLVLLGVESGLLSESNYQRIVAIAVCSLIITPPLLKVGLGLVDSKFTAADVDQTLHIAADPRMRATIVGAGPTGRQLASQLEIMGRDVCIIDLSPINLHPFAQEGFRTIAGDATNPRQLKLALVDESFLTIVCVPNDETAIRIVRAIRKLNPQGTLIVRCRYMLNAEKLRHAGADHVISEEAEASFALMRMIHSIE